MLPSDAILTFTKSFGMPGGYSAIYELCIPGYYTRTKSMQMQKNIRMKSMQKKNLRMKSIQTKCIPMRSMQMKSMRMYTNENYTN